MKESWLKPLPTDDELAHLNKAGSRHRRSMGVVIGAMLGLVYGVISQSINPLRFPGVPFYQPPYGPAINAMLCFIAGALMGLISAWPQESVLGVLIASMASALVLGGVTFATARMDWRSGLGVFLTTLVLVLPFTALAVPVAASLRWATNKQEDAYRASHWTWSRVLAPLLLLVVTGGLAISSLYPPEARPVLERVKALVQAGQAAFDINGLPEPFKSDSMAGFLENSQGAFTLEWNRQVERYGAVMLPGSDTSEQSVVVVHMQNGWAFACLFATPDVEPICKNVPR